jgi:hypothetical protein
MVRVYRCNKMRSACVDRVDHHFAFWYMLRAWVARGRCEEVELRGSRVERKSS